MPRVSSIKPNEERISNIDLSFIQRKNCLGVKLKFNKSFTPKQWHTLKTYFKCEINEDENTIAIKLGNSWKGLVMFFLSVSYMEHGGNLENALLKKQKKYGKVQWEITNVSKHYYELVPNSVGPKETRTDDQIERIAAPPSWKPYYVKGNYDTDDIKCSIDNFSILLEVDTKHSVIEYDNAKQIPHQYKHRTAKCAEENGLLCSIFKGCTEGIAFTTEKNMDILYGKRYAIKVNHEFSPKMVAKIMEIEDDPMRPIPIYGYKITKESEPYLCRYFPYLEADFRREAKMTGSPTYVVFDRVHLGKWG